MLGQHWPGLRRPDGQPIRVLILGAGMVDKHAVEAATKLGNVERNIQHMQDDGPGVIVLTIGRNVSGKPGLMEKLFREADILVDATQRRDPSRPVVPNDWIAWLPEHAIITDLAVDPYTLDIDPPVVRGVEGIRRAISINTCSRPTTPTGTRPCRTRFRPDSATRWSHVIHGPAVTAQACSLGMNG